MDKRKLTKEFQQKIVVDAPIISNGIWSVKAMYAEEVICSLFKNTDRKFYKINDKDAELKIIVGPQVLDKKFYYLTGDIDANGMFKGSNNENEDVVIEKELVRPIQGNSKLYSFSKKFSPEYILFPYDNEIVPLNLDYIENNYPKGFQYLSKVKKESKTRRNPGEKWYTYTRKQNLQYLTTPKIFIPMTCKNVIASLQSIPCYGDNSNVNAVISLKQDVELLKAVCMIFNSKVFNLLALSLSGDQRGGYHKLNKQYLGNVPIPVLSEQEKVKLVTLYEQLVKLVDKFVKSVNEVRDYYLLEIEKIDRKLNEMVSDIYQIPTESMNKMKKYVGKTDSWIDLLH